MARRVLLSTANEDGSEASRVATESSGGRQKIYDEVALDASGLISAVGDGPSSDLQFDTLLRQQAVRTGDVTLSHLVAASYVPEDRVTELSQSYANYIADLPQGSPLLDIVAFLVWIKLETRDEAGRTELSRVTGILRDSFSPRISRGGFTAACQPPVDFYSQYPKVQMIARTLMTPIVQSHEGDFVTVSSINPLSAAASANLIATWFEQKNAQRKPFAFLLALDSNDWTEMCSKHFS